jgi:hypothetical protein
MGSQGLLGSGDAPDGIQSAGKGNEEGIALSVDFVPVVLSESRAQQIALVGQNYGVLFFELLKQPGRAFNVRK